MRPRQDGRAPRPYSLKDANLAQLGVIYHWNKNAWQYASTFRKWLQAAKAELASRRGRSPAVILVDNFSAHKAPVSEEDGALQHHEFEGGILGFKYDFLHVLFLPSRATSRIQPLDQEIIQSWKVFEPLDLSSLLKTHGYLIWFRRLAGGVCKPNQ